MSTDMLDAALEYAELGMSVIPTRGKVAAGSWKEYQHRRADADQLTRWFADGDFNQAIVTGAISNIVVIDGDDADGMRHLFQLGTDARTPLARSGRAGGGLHQYFQHPGMRVTSHKGHLPHLDVQADGAYIVAPPSIHPLTGRRYEWLTPLWFVAPAPLPPAVLAFLLAKQRGNRHDVPPGAILQGERNEILYRIALSRANRGVRGAALLEAILTLNRERCTPPMPGDDVMDLVHRAEALAMASGPDAELARLRAAWGAFPFKNASDRLAVKAALDMAADFGRMTVALSVRDVADRIGVGTQTAARAIHRVQALGWLTLARSAHRSHATLFRVTSPTNVERLPFSQSVGKRDTISLNLHLPPEPTSPPPSVSLPDRSDQETTESVSFPDKSGKTTESVSFPDRSALLLRALAHVDPEHDVWRRGALGKVCMVCYAVLLELGQTTARDLAGCLGRRHVRDHLTTLRTHGLATCAKGRWRPVHVSLAELDRIAASFGTHGKGQRQRERHARQRAAHQSQVEAGPPVVAQSAPIAVFQLSWTVSERDEKRDVSI